jgi:glycosyltransferase involved in cell wall biosynthesis
VLICTYNRAGMLRETLAALLAMTPADDVRVEIIIVDNNSTDATPLIIAEVARDSCIPVVGLRETSQGKSFALNRGLRAATGDIVALTDDDVWPDANWLNRIVDVSVGGRDVRLRQGAAAVGHPASPGF